MINMLFSIPGMRGAWCLLQRQFETGDERWGLRTRTGWPRSASVRGQAEMISQLIWKLSLIKICLTSEAWPRCWPSLRPQWGGWTPPVSLRTCLCEWTQCEWTQYDWTQPQCFQSQWSCSHHQPLASARSPCPLGPHWRWSPQSLAGHENGLTFLQTFFTFLSKLPHCVECRNWVGYCAF